MSSMYPWTYGIGGSGQDRAAFSHVTRYTDPYIDVASTVMPVSVPAMLRHAEFLAASGNETFREALGRVAAYFITDVEVAGDLGADEREQQKNYLVTDMNMMSNLYEAALSYLVYGNQYTSVIQPIVRYLVCPKCRTQYRLADIIERPACRVRFVNKFTAACAACGYEGHMGGGPGGAPKDVPDESRPPIFKSWNPHDIRPVWVDSIGQATEYHWVIPGDVRTEIKQASGPGGNKAVLCETPWEHLHAAVSDMNVKFKADYLHHWWEPRLAGLRFRGYGVPRAIINYRQLFHTQILRRMNEVLALGHVVPVRVVSPANTSGRDEGGDILKTTYMGDLRSRFEQIMSAHRLDPTTISYSPIPLQYQALGADAQQLAAADILNQANDVLLNGSGIPVEFYRMSMQAQTAPVALRLMERYWAPLVSGLNRLLTFVARRLQFLLRWDAADVKLASVRLVDSIELNQLRVQMAQAGLLSRTSALQTVDANFNEETRRKFEETREEQTVQSDFQQQSDAFAFSRQMADLGPGAAMAAQQQQQGGASAPGGAPQQGGQPAPDGSGAPPAAPGTDQMANIMPQPGMKIDPAEYDSRATAAAQILIQLPEAQRYGELQKLRESNDQFHALVRDKMEEMRSDARSKGQQLVLQQQYGAQPQ